MILDYQMKILNQVFREYRPTDVCTFLCDNVPMLRHGQIWQAIDRLAKRNGLSVSGLARRSGLDPTTFNPSKRVTPQGKPRWPSTESLAKVLNATSTDLDDFIGLVSDRPSEAGLQRLPLLGYAQAGMQGYFDDAGYPVGTGWDEVVFPDFNDPTVYALEVTGDSMEPVYRDGDRILVSPSAPIRRGDRVVVRTSSGEVMAKELLRRTASRVELGSINPRHELRAVPLEDVQWMARIIWASQ